MPMHLMRYAIKSSQRLLCLDSTHASDSLYYKIFMAITVHGIAHAFDVLCYKIIVAITVHVNIHASDSFFYKIIT